MTASQPNIIINNTNNNTNNNNNNTKRPLPVDIAENTTKNNGSQPPLADITLIHALPDFVVSESTENNAVEEDLASMNVLKWSGPVSLNLSPPVDVLKGVVGEDVEGMLYVCTSRIYYFHPQRSCGLSITYPAVIMHAVSRSPGPSIYCQLDREVTNVDLVASDSADLLTTVDLKNGLDAQEDENVIDGNDDTDVDMAEEDEAMSDLKIVPKDLGAVDAIYQNISECAVLHPDQYDDEDDEEDSDVEMSQDEYFTAAGLQQLNRLEGLMDGVLNENGDMGSVATGSISDGQFDDAPEH